MPRIGFLIHTRTSALILMTLLRSWNVAEQDLNSPILGRSTVPLAHKLPLRCVPPAHKEGELPQADNKQMPSASLCLPR